MRGVCAVQSSKRQKFIDFLPKPLLDFSWTVSTNSEFEANESPALNLTSKPPGVALIPQVSRITKMSRVRQGVSKYLLYNLWQVRSLALHNKILK